MNASPSANLLNTFNLLQSATPDLGLVLLAGFALILVGFSLLMYRQARQMTHVLPTPLSPVVQTTVLGYVVLTIVTLSLIIAAIL